MNRHFIQGIMLLSSAFLLCDCAPAPADNTMSISQPKEDQGESAVPAVQIEEETITPTKIGAIPVPDGYHRSVAGANSFGEYLRHVTLKTDNDTVFQYDGVPKYPQDVHHAILTIDVGKRDLQQCADAVMRLRGEYLFANKRYDEIHFNFLSDGKPRYYKDHADSAHSHKSFRKYMDYIFSYANTASLKKEMRSVAVNEMQIGDVFIQRGAPFGHAVIVVDMAANSKGEKLFMIAQSFMPAQEIHILKNFTETQLSPWYSLDFGVTLSTPQWLFNATDLKRF